MSNESLQMMAGGGEMCDMGLLLATSGGSSVPITSVEMQLATGWRRLRDYSNHK